MNKYISAMLQHNILSLFELSLAEIIAGDLPGFLPESMCQYIEKVDLDYANKNRNIKLILHFMPHTVDETELKKMHAEKYDCEQYPFEKYRKNMLFNALYWSATHSMHAVLYLVEKFHLTIDYITGKGEKNILYLLYKNGQMETFRRLVEMLHVTTQHIIDCEIFQQSGKYGTLDDVEYVFQTFFANHDMKWDYLHYVMLKTCETGNLEMMKWASAFNVSMERILLDHAIENGKLNIVQYLVETHRFLSPPGKNSKPLQLACFNRRYDVAKYIMSISYLEYDSSFIMSALRTCNLEFIEYVFGELGITTLDIGRGWCDVDEEVFIYLDKKFVYRTNYYDGHILKIACDNFGLRAVQSLLERENQISLEYIYNGFTAAIEKGKYDIAQYILSKHPLKKNRKMVISCFSFGDLNFVKLMVKYFKVNAKDIKSSHNLIFRHACGQGHLDILMYIVPTFKFTVDDARSIDNEALRVALCNGHFDVVDYLMRTFNLNKIDALSHDNYALITACAKGRLDIVKYITRVFSMNEIDWNYNYNEAFRGAFTNGHMDIVEYFVNEMGLVINDDKTISMLLTFACHENKNLSALKYLMETFNLNENHFSQDIIEIIFKPNNMSIIEYVVETIQLPRDALKKAYSKQFHSSYSMKKTIEFLHFFTVKYNFNSKTTGVAPTYRKYLKKYVKDNAHCSSGDFEIIKYMLNHIYTDPDEKKMLIKYLGENAGPNLLKYLNNQF
jgi:Ankyrin repeats (3 copies)